MHFNSNSIVAFFVELVDIYYVAFPKDKWLLKLAVIWVFLIGTAQTILAVIDISSFATGDQNCAGDFLSRAGYFSLTVVASSSGGEYFLKLLLPRTDSMLLVISRFGSPMALCL